MISKVARNEQAWAMAQRDGEASALAQGGVILPLVRHPRPLFRDVVAAIGVGFERHDWDPGALRREAGSSIWDMPGGALQAMI
jgi:hypothetical protein